MKKIVILLGLLMVFNGCAYAAQDEVLPLKVSDVKVFSDDGYFGLKDKNGNIVVEAKYKKLIKVGDGAWIIQQKNRFGLIDSNGGILVKPRYRHVERVFGKYVKLGNDNDYGLYDETGKAVIAPEYSSIEPLFGKMFLTCKKYKYGIVDFEGKKLLDNEFDDIYMPNPKALRVQYEGEWYEIERLKSENITLPEGVKKVKINNEDFQVTHLVTNTGLLSGYSAVTAADYTLKILSSISPAYEDTIDDLMLSQGADTISIFVKLGWIPKFPFTYAKKYYQNLRNPNNGPLSGVKNELKRQIK